MSASVALSLKINGEMRDVACPPFETLLDALRERLHMTGAKKGCNQGVCGACTVLVDGRPVRGCLTLAADCAGRVIETIEGQAEGVTLSRVQAAFVAANAAQCGFCTPGMVLTVTALLRERPKPAADEVRTALSGNLCRCSGYAAIVEAALKAAEAGAA